MTTISINLPPTLKYHIISEMNLARRNPKQYISRIQDIARRGSYAQSDIQETINFLQNVTPCNNILVSEPVLDLVAQNWVALQGPKGDISHGDFIGRVRKAGKYLAIAENLQYGYLEAADIVADWIIDEGIPGKGHRVNIFNCRYDQIGIGFGLHKTYRTMTDAIFATGFQSFV